MDPRTVAPASGEPKTHNQALSSPANQTSRQTEPEGLADSIMRTVVASEADALNILFEAARDETAPPNDPGSVGRDSQASFLSDHQYPGTAETAVASAQAPNQSPQPNELVALSSPTLEVLRVWSAYRFVVMGWFSAEEAVTLVDA